MWEMLDPDLECGNECGGPGPPPEFRIPPPPRPPFLAELSNCNEDGAGGGSVAAMLGPGGSAATSFATDGDICEAIPILDASYHSSPSFQTSAMIVLCSVLLLLVIFISSLLVWKHKRKVQNFLPCKTPTRGPPHHLDATGVSAAHSVTYEDPDVHLGHHPLVMRHHHHHHHHNMELHHPKQLHYPSGYPMPRSPPLFICSSPGPDPYRSHDNVYEELEHPRDTDSEPPVQSDDDFAEDELSLPGDRSFHKSSSDGGTTVATIYHDRSASSNGGTNSGSNTDQYMERNRTERNSLLSSSSSGNDNNLRQGAAAGTSNGAGSASGVGNNRNSNSSTECTSSASGNNNNSNGCSSGGSSSNNNNSNSSGTNNNSTGGGLFRSRKQQPSTLGSGRGNKHVNNLNSLGEPPCEMAHTLPTGYDERAMMTLPPSYQAAAAAATVAGTARTSPNNLNSINNNSFVNSNSLNNNNSSRGNYYSTIDDECDPVERRNRINAQLSASAAAINNGGPGVSTIFRNGRPPHNNINHNHHNHHTTNASSRSRTNPRSLDRRRFLINNNNNINNNATTGSNLAVISTQDPSQYIYHEPVFHEGLIYDACLSYSDRSSGSSAGPPYPYILPQFTTFRNHHGSGPGPGHAIYSRDSSFGSDSGYSQHTQASNRSVGWSRNRPPQPVPQQQQLQTEQPQRAVTDS